VRIPLSDDIAFDDAPKSTPARLRKIADATGVPYTLEADSGEYTHIHKFDACPSCGRTGGEPDNTNAHLCLRSGKLWFKCYTDTCHHFRAPDLIAKFCPDEYTPTTLGFQSWRKTYHEKPKILVPGLYYEREMGVAVGTSKSKKSFFATQMGICWAAELPFLGFRPESPLRVWFIDYELDPNHMHHSRLAWQAESLGIDLNDTRILNDENLMISNWRGTPKDITALEDEAERYGPFADFAIIDSIYKTYPVGMNENDNAAVSSLMARFLAMTRVHNLTIQGMHHVPKDAFESFDKKDLYDIGAGAGSFGRACDSMLVLAPGASDTASEVLRIHRGNRNMPTQPPLFCAFNSDTGLFELDGGQGFKTKKRGAAATEIDPEQVLAWVPAKKDAILKESFIRKHAVKPFIGRVKTIVEELIADGRVIEFGGIKGKGKKQIYLAEGEE
jgi:hypothetical protein